MSIFPDKTSVQSQSSDPQYPILRLFVNGNWHSYSLSPGTYDVGRARQCAISIEHPEVSRIHAQITVHPDGRTQLIDGDGFRPSRNGTFVKNARIQDCWLDPGETIHFGSTFVAAHLEMPSTFSGAYTTNQPVPKAKRPVNFQEELTTIVFSEEPELQPKAGYSSSEERIQQLEEQLARTQLELKQQQDSFSSLYAEFDSFRQRVQGEADRSVQRIKETILLEFLAIADNFDLAQQQVKATTDQEFSIHSSYQAVYRVLVKAFKKMGVARIESVNQPFDPLVHEAIDITINPTVSEDTVLVEHQAGYTLDQNVIRPAKVTVSKRQ